MVCGLTIYKMILLPYSSSNAVVVSPNYICHKFLSISGIKKKVLTIMFLFYNSIVITYNIWEGVLNLNFFILFFYFLFYKRDQIIPFNNKTFKQVKIMYLYEKGQH